MEEFWLLILVLFFATNSLDKAESVQLEELEALPLQTFDELFVDEWLDNDKAEEWHKLTLEQNFHHKIDQQNTQLGQIESNSTDQNPPLTESDHSDNSKNSKEQNEIIEITTSNEKFNGKYSKKEWNQIEEKIAKHLKVTRSKVYKWKRELGQSTPNLKYSDSEQKELMKRYYEIKGQNPIISDEKIAKMLKIGTTTLYRWKKQFERQKFDQNSVDGYSVEVNAGVRKLGDVIK